MATPRVIGLFMAKLLEMGGTQAKAYLVSVVKFRNLQNRVA
jgi:hypothetical protein